MLAVGVDYAEQFHLVALGNPERGVFDVRRVMHEPSSLDGLIRLIGRLEPDPGDVRVVLETSHGALVERLVEAGYLVLPVNPRQVACRRIPAAKRDDAEDARLCCLIALDRFEPIRPLVPHGEAAAELRVIARDDERAARDARRLANRLRADLIAAFPQALQVAGEDLGAPVFLVMLERRPSAPALAGASRAELVAFARDAHHGWPERFAERVIGAMAAEHFAPRPYLVRAKADTIALGARRLLAIAAQRRAWERRVAELLIGPGVPEQQRSIPGGEVYLSFPGLGVRLAARVAGETGDHPEQFRSPNALRCYAGKAPVTRRSGTRELVVARRLSGNRHLDNAVQQWAFCSLLRSGWAREFHEAKRARGQGHHAALRALGNRWLEVPWHCLMRGTPYDERVHVANRCRALAAAA